MAGEASIIPDRYIATMKSFAALPSFPVACSYLVMTLLAGLWKNVSRPLSLKMIMVFYNFSCVLLSFVAFSFLVYGCYDSRSFFTMTYNKYVEFGCWMYMVSKFVELLDTVFMILRHKSRQISFLHVYHHFSILLLGDYSYRYAPWPPIGVLLGLNSLVHVFMYTYYGQTAYTSEQKPEWKKAITQLQIAQFLFAIVHATLGYLYYKFCVYSIFYSCSMLALFSNFYYHAYLRPRKVKDSESKKNE